MRGEIHVALQAGLARRARKTQGTRFEGARTGDENPGGPVNQPCQLASRPGTPGTRTVLVDRIAGPQPKISGIC